MESSDSCGSEGQTSCSSDSVDSEEASSNESEAEGEDIAASPTLYSCESIILFPNKLLL